MTDNVRGGSTDTALPLVAADEVTYSGEVAKLQLVRLVRVEGTEGSRTVAEIIDVNGLDVDVTRLPGAPTATLSNVAGATSSETLLALNAARKGATIFNDSTATLFVKFGAAASTTSFTVKMAAGAYYEIPFGYTGRIDGIWDAANGNARITELT